MRTAHRFAAARGAKSKESERLRRRMEAAVERLLAALDALELDPDLEAEADLEPSLGWPENGPQFVCGQSDSDREEDDADLEPSLGAPEPSFFTTAHQDSDGRLVVTTYSGSQVQWARGGDEDIESDEAENGIADGDALWELRKGEEDSAPFTGPDPYRI